MNRRQMMILPGAALMANRGSAQVVQRFGPGFERPAQRVSPKVLLKYSRLKAISKVPKTEAKSAKYLSSLTTLLSLSSDQQAQATTVFGAAVTTQAALRKSLKAARESLGAAVMKNDSAGINQASGAIGMLTAQITAAGAKANAAFYQILTPDQQSKLAQF
jgi:poly-gamma-glutamate capsule biosynthesis protein CapA/YwtB (metallophosphatase superfamily)